MSFATTQDGVKLYFEETGKGTPIVFVHEYAGDYRSWEPQIRFLADVTAVLHIVRADTRHQTYQET